MSKLGFFLAGPCHDNRVAAGAGRIMASQRHRVIYRTETRSLLAFNFNFLLCEALHLRDEGQVTHLAMIHSDVDPEPWWIDKLLMEKNRAGVDLMAAVIPIKGPQGLTSTAIDNPADPWNVERRLSMHEIMALPETFTALDVCPGRMLLANTGLWICDLRKPWFDDDDFCFAVEDRIVRERLAGKVQRQAETIPEDWAFSRLFQKKGGTIGVTRKVQLVHHGCMGWGNHVAWGEWDFDREYASAPLGAREEEVSP